MRIVALVLLLGALLPAMECFADEPADARTYWAYEGGWFARSKNGSWYELNEFTFRKLGKPSVFREVKRTKEYIELLDEGRDVGIRLFEKNAKVRDPGKEWVDLYKGKWKEPVAE